MPSKDIAGSKMHLFRQYIEDKHGSIRSFAKKHGIEEQIVYAWFRVGLIPAERARAIHDREPDARLSHMRPDLWTIS